MSMSELIGIIKLSYRQAEGRRVSFAVLCLKYILSAAASFVFALLTSVAENGEHKTLLLIGATVSAVFAIFFRAFLVKEAYLTSECFLRCENDGEPLYPGISAIISGELACLSAVCTACTVMLSPAYVCFRFALRYYSLSSDKKLFMLLTAASILFATGGFLFFCVIRARLGCARYLWLSGQCQGFLSAMDNSWELTRGSCGDMLGLLFFSSFCGVPIRLLCSMNLSGKLLRQKGLPIDNGLRVEIVSDNRGERHFELF